MSLDSPAAAPFAYEKDGAAIYRQSFATIRAEVGSSVAPPNIMVPRHRGEIFKPLRPS